MKITPAWTATFETNLQTLIQDSWKRSTLNSTWDKFVDVRTSTTLRELYFYLLETARITDQGQGGNKRYDDIAATFFEIDNRDSGAALMLTKNEIEDNMMASPKGMPALDYSANWAKQMGGNAGYWPQQKFFELLKAGETSNGYDAVSFFNKAHPINVYNGGLTYANLLTGAAASTPATDPMQASYPGACPIDVTNAALLETAARSFTNAVAYVQNLTQPNGLPRNLRVRYALHGNALRYRMEQILDSKFYGSGQGATDNIITKYQIEPVLGAEVDGIDPLAYYLACELMPGEGGPIIFQNREPYKLTTFQPETQVELMRRKTFEWLFDGRNAESYGHPYLLFKVKAT